MDDRQVIECFENAEDLAAKVRAKGVDLTRSAVYEWKRNGIPARWRRLVAQIASESGHSLPKGFVDPPSNVTKQEHAALSVGEAK